MTVKELIAALAQQDPNAKVCFAHPANDYWRTTLAREVRRAGTEQVVFSAYHDMLKVVSEDEESTDLDAVHPVLVLR